MFTSCIDHDKDHSMYHIFKPVKKGTMYTFMSTRQVNTAKYTAYLNSLYVHFTAVLFEHCEISLLSP